VLSRFSKLASGRHKPSHRDDTTCPAPKDGEKIRVPILGPLILAIVVLIGLSIGGAYLLQTRDISDRVWDQIAEVRLLFGERFTADSQLLQRLSDVLAGDDQLQHDWQTRDRAALLRHAEPMLERLRSERRVTHLYFHDLEQTCFLRVHDPNLYGDRIERTTLSAAIRTGHASGGMELGPRGTLTLRAVCPWRIDGQLVGYIELGEEIGHVVRTMRNTLDVELVIVVNKSLLDRRRWEEGMRMLGRTPHWDARAGGASDGPAGPAAEPPVPLQGQRPDLSRRDHAAVRCLQSRRWRNYHHEGRRESRVVTADVVQPAAGAGRDHGHRADRSLSLVCRTY
jgi:hypothetical protein